MTVMLATSRRHLLGGEVRTADQAAADHGRWVFLVEDLEQLGPSGAADLDHHACDLVTACDLPQPATDVSACALVPTEVGADLPTAYVRR